MSRERHGIGVGPLSADAGPPAATVGLWRLTRLRKDGRAAAGLPTSTHSPRIFFGTLVVVVIVIFSKAGGPRPAVALCIQNKLCTSFVGSAFTFHFATSAGQDAWSFDGKKVRQMPIVRPANADGRFQRMSGKCRYLGEYRLTHLF